MGLTSFINKKLTHPRDRDNDFGVRVVLHVPIGVLLGILLNIFPVVGCGLLVLFLVYDWTEDWRVYDHAWKDLYGALVGTVIGIASYIIHGVFA